jgi:hypothetical protein
MGSRLVSAEVAYTCDRCHASQTGTNSLPEGWERPLTFSYDFTESIGQINVGLGHRGLMAQFQLPDNPVVALLVCPDCAASLVEWLLAPFTAKHGPDLVVPRREWERRRREEQARPKPEADK